MIGHDIIHEHYLQMQALAQDPNLTPGVLEAAALDKRIRLHLWQVEREMRHLQPERAACATVRLVRMIRDGKRGLSSVEYLREICPQRRHFSGVQAVMEYNRRAASRNERLDLYLLTLDDEDCPSLQRWEVTDARARQEQRERDRALDDDRYARQAQARLRVPGKARR
jgi:hypothetical protein